ncbi:hypothetical protein HYN59_07960 [Flavobacterium album]|uniref:Uncharacterized protein n=1 Tax=Flavobacterium album TaxID=2175091 RepID=A0A2S1QXF4_9FLAO|nr:hypothetical protein [Flavobacterium album]AWH85065.1 hypothetical protein HYN59_07960 [Flavobacterium album]
MQAIRKMVNSNKGFMTFWLVLFFLTAGQAKTFCAAAPSFHKKETTRTESVKQLSVTEGSSSANFLEQIKDSDIDDMPFAFFGDLSFNTLISQHTSYFPATTAVSCSNGYKVPLYELYCNWKFDFLK